MKKSVIYILSILMLILPVQKISAQSENTVTKPVPATFLDINPDPYAMSMGNAGAAMNATAFSMWNNNASTVFSENKMDIGLSYGMWQPGMSGNNVIALAGYGNVADFMSISAGFKYLMDKPYDISNEDGLHLGQFKPSDMTIGVGLAFKFAKIVSLSANFNYIHSAIADDAKANAFGVDFGAMVNLRFMKIGLTASNIGTKIKYAEKLDPFSMPANIKLGLGTTQKLGSADVKKHEISASLQAGYVLSYNTFFAELGLEYKYNDLFRVAAGYHYGDSKVYIPQYASVGLGFKVAGVYLNASYLIGLGSQSPISNTFSVGLGYSF